jgi:hypothetical protein
MYSRILWKLVGILGAHCGKQWSSGFLTKQQLLLSLTEGAGCVLSSTKECCYRTLYWMNTDMGLGRVATQSAAPEGGVAGHPCAILRRVISEGRYNLAMTQW